jgi:hypothetical protein
MLGSGDWTTSPLPPGFTSSDWGQLGDLAARWPHLVGSDYARAELHTNPADSNMGPAN